MVGKLLFSADFAPGWKGNSSLVAQRVLQGATKPPTWLTMAWEPLGETTQKAGALAEPKLSLAQELPLNVFENLKMHFGTG